METWAQYLGGCIFSCSRGNSIFFVQFPFWYFGLSITAWKRRFGFWSYFYFLKESHSVPDMVFLQIFNYFVLFGVIKNRFTKINFKFLIEIVTVPVVLIDELYFYMCNPIKAWLYEKNIFELVYLLLVALKSLVSY